MASRRSGGSARAPGPVEKGWAVTQGKVRSRGATGRARRGVPSHWWWLLAVAAAAALLRLLEVHWISAHPFFATPVIDASEYLQWALETVERLRAGEGLNAFLWDEVPIHGPVYPALLALLHLVAGGSMFAVRALQGALLGTGLCAALYLLTNRMFPWSAPWAGIVAAAFSATAVPLIRYDVELLATSTSGLLIALAVLALTAKPQAADPAGAGERGRPDGCPLRPPKPWPTLAAGLLLGLAALTRPNALLCLPFLAAWIVRAAWRQRSAVAGDSGGAKPMAVLRLLVPAFLLLASASAAVLPAMLWNARLGSGRLTMIQANGGLNLYLGNGPEATGVPVISQGTDWIRLLHAPRIEAGAKNPAEEDAYHIARVKAFIRSSPGPWLKLLLRKAGLLLHGTEVRGGIWAAGYPGDPLGRFPLPRFGWILPLALAGLFAAARRRRLASAASVMLGAYGLTLVATMVGERYRLPAVPLLIPYAAFAVILLGRRLLGREGERARHRTLVIALPGLAALFLVVNVPLFDVRPPDRAEGHFLLSYVQYKNGDFQRALSEAEAAVELNESYALGWYHLALCLQRTTSGAAGGPDSGRIEEAYRRAVDLAPDYAEAMENLGALLYQQGRLEEATAWYRRAANARPFRPQPRHALGVLAEHGEDGNRFSAGWDAAAAEGYFRKAAELDPVWPAPRFDLGVVFSRTGRHAEAAEQYRQVLAVDPGHYQAWFYLALALEQTGDLREAVDAMDHCLRLRPRDPEAWFQAGRLAEVSGDPAMARERYRQALALNPRHRGAAQRLEGVFNAAPPSN